MVDEKPKLNEEFKRQERKPTDANTKKTYDSKNSWGDADKKETEKTGVRQLNPNLVSRPSKPFNNEERYGKTRDRGYNEGKPRNRKYD